MNDHLPQVIQLEDLRLVIDRKNQCVWINSQPRLSLGFFISLLSYSRPLGELYELLKTLG